MKKTDGSIKKTNPNGSKEKADLFTYSEKEKQQHELNEQTAKLVFKPTFIPYFPKLEEQFSLTKIETLAYGFVWFYLSGGAKRFYFTDVQLGKILNCHEDTAGEAINTLKKHNLLKTTRRVKGGGGTIRFVRLGQKTPSEEVKTLPLKRSKDTTNNNKINNNKINISSKTEEYVEKFNLLFAYGDGTRNYRPTSKRRRKMSTRLKTFTFGEIMASLKNLSHSDWAHGKNDKDWEATPDYLLQNDERIDKWLNRDPNKKESKYQWATENGKN